jgi:hypothetical protein
MELSHNVVKHEVEIENIQRELRELRQDVKQITLILNRAQGSWKALVMVGGFASAVGAAMAKFITFWGGH